MSLTPIPVHYLVEREGAFVPFSEAACGRNGRRMEFTCVPANVTCVHCKGSQDFKEMQEAA